MLGQDYEYVENRRRGSVDEDAGEYEYDYNPQNGLGPTVELGNGGPRKEFTPPRPISPVRSPDRLAPLPPRQSFRPRPNEGGGYQRRPTTSGLVGKEACQSGAKSTAHESACDLYYDCYEGQGFLQQCPNGLVFAGDGRFGLIGECDYPHNIPCSGRGERSKYSHSNYDILHGMRCS